MWNAFVVLAAGSILSLPILSHTVEDEDYGYDSGEYGDEYGQDGGYPDDYDYNDRRDDLWDGDCPDSFETVFSFEDEDLCCKRVHHEGEDLVVCISRHDEDRHDHDYDHDHGDHDHGDHDHGDHDHE